MDICRNISGSREHSFCCAHGFSFCQEMLCGWADGSKGTQLQAGMESSVPVSLRFSLSAQEHSSSHALKKKKKKKAHSCKFFATPEILFVPTVLGLTSLAYRLCSGYTAWAKMVEPQRWHCLKSILVCTSQTCSFPTQTQWGNQLLLNGISS